MYLKPKNKIKNKNNEIYIRIRKKKGKKKDKLRCGLKRASLLSEFKERKICDDAKVTFITL